MYTEITRDLFCIVKRLRKINPNYKVFFNNRDLRFEVWEKAPAAGGGTPFTKGGMAFVVPYTELDTRTLEYARKTRKENADFIEQEITANNNAIEQSAKQHIKIYERELAEMLAFALNSSHEVTFGTQTKWF